MEQGIKLDDITEAKVLAYIREGKSINAIKLVWDTNSCSLKEAKTFVEGIIDEMYR